MTQFHRAVISVVKTMAPGQTLSYAQVAQAAGYPGAARAVGSLMKSNTDSAVPCHRVIKSDGTPGDYNQGPAKKRARLLQEGANIR